MGDAARTGAAKVLRCPPVMTPSTWLAVAQRIQAISQTGLAFATDQYDINRYREVLEESGFI